METKNLSPEVYISVNKNRQKIHPNNTVYLKNGSEFEFEFFNLAQYTIMARISINGQPISTRGLVYRSGQHAYLERFIDENRKFIYETYVVDASSKAVQNAIQNNGDITVEFFKEKITPPRPVIRRNSMTLSRGICKGSSEKLFDCSDDIPTFSRSAVDFAPDFDNNTRGFGQSKMRCSSMSNNSLKKLETGRVEKGGSSDQTFTEISMEFEYNPIKTVTYKLLPISQKPVEANELKVKCNKCSTNLKTGWKFCPVCSTPVGEGLTCDNCNFALKQTWKVCPNCGQQI